MMRSITRRAAFRRESQVVSLAAFVLGFGTTLAIAQQGQDVPKMPPKPTTNTGSVQRNISAWVKVCSKNEQTKNNRFAYSNTRGLILKLETFWWPPPCAPSRARINRT